LERVNNIKRVNNIRLQKLIARYGYASRRKAEDLIKKSKVRVNGNIVKKLGTKVRENSLIEVDSRVINRNIPKIYLILNKPKGYMCTKDDQFKRKTIFDLIDDRYKNLGIFNVGRLDYLSQGLLIITNDGIFANKVSHPSNRILKEYVVTTDKSIPYPQIDEWKKGVFIDGIRYKIEDFNRIDSRNIRLILREGKNREIRRLFNHIGINVTRLIRIAIGSIKLENLPVGEYRKLTDDELKSLIKFG